MSKHVGSKSLRSQPFQQAATDYHPDAFLFVRMGLSKTMRRLGKNRTEVRDRHVTGQELARGLRDIAQRRYGLLALTVLNRWNIHSTLDFGRIVYALIDAGLLSKSQEDTLNDFADVYDFRKTFTEPRMSKKAKA